MKKSIFIGSLIFLGFLFFHIWNFYRLKAEWKNFFDGNAEMRAKFMRDTLVGKVDENTAIVTADIFDPEGMKQAF